MNQNDRYTRQTALPEIGEAGQAAIAAASILCIGAGGLGCPVLLYLAAAGVGRIGIVDFDTVDETNLQRQVLFTTEQIGQNKAEAAKERITALNPDINIQTYSEELTDQNAGTLFADYDLIIDGTDNFATKFLINDTAAKTGKPFIYGSILGFEGQLAVFNHQDGPCYRCLFPEPPKGHIPNCAEAGVIGAVAGLVGTSQAMEAIKLIIGHENFETLSGKLWTIDARTMETKRFALPKNPNCPTCSKPKEEITLSYSSPVCGFIPEISVEDTKNRKNALLIDVRELDEWNAGHIEEAKHIALSKLMEGLQLDLPKNSEIILYCKTGPRSLHAAQMLKAQGYENVSNMTGGYTAWCQAA